jgi:hypothetical protein
VATRRSGEPCAALRAYHSKGNLNCGIVQTEDCQYESVMSFLEQTKSLRDAKLTPPATYLGLIGGALLVAALAITALFGIPKTVEFLDFVFLAGLAPPAAAFILAAAERWPAELADRCLSVRVFLYFCLAGTLVVAVGELTLAKDLRGHWAFLGLLAACGAAAWHVLRTPSQRTRFRNWTETGALDAVLLALTVAIALLLSPLTPRYRTVDLLAYVFDTPNFLWWLVGGFALVGLVWWLQRQRFATNAVAGAAGFLALIVFVLSLFDYELYFNVPHYIVHVAPAMASLHGGVAMVDVFCIYGLASWLVIQSGLSGDRSDVRRRCSCRAPLDAGLPHRDGGGALRDLAAKACRHAHDGAADPRRYHVSSGPVQSERPALDVRPSLSRAGAHGAGHHGRRCFAMGTHNRHALARCCVTVGIRGVRLHAGAVGLCAFSRHHPDPFNLEARRHSSH